MNIINPEGTNQCLGCGIDIDEEFDYYTGDLIFLCYECRLEPCENCGYRLNRNHGDQRDQDQICDSCGQFAFPSHRLIRCNGCGEPFREVRDPNGNIIELCETCRNFGEDDGNRDEVIENPDEDQDDGIEMIEDLEEDDEDDDGIEVIDNPEENIIDDEGYKSDEEMDVDDEEDDEEEDEDEDDMIEVIPEEERIERLLIEHERIR